MTFQPPSNPYSNPVPKYVPTPIPTPFQPLFQYIPHTPLGLLRPLGRARTLRKGDCATQTKARMAWGWRYIPRDISTPSPGFNVQIDRMPGSVPDMATELTE